MGPLEMEMGPTNERTTPMGCMKATRWRRRSKYRKAPSSSPSSRNHSMVIDSRPLSLLPEFIPGLVSSVRAAPLNEEDKLLAHLMTLIGWRILN